MPATKNLCAQISLDLHQKISEAREAAGLTTAQYITELLTEYFKMKENGGNITMTNNNTRTLAFQISEELFQRIKAHLERETVRTGRKLTHESRGCPPPRRGTSSLWRRNRRPLSAPRRGGRRSG